MLEIKNLHAEIDGKKILDGVNLVVKSGEVAAIMGPNGSGKSTLSYVIAGRPGYEVTAGEVWLDGENILEIDPHERAAKGLFLAFQYPLEIPGVTTMTFLKAAMNAQRKQRGEAELSTPDFMKKVRAAAVRLGVKQEMLRRALNVGFSGGEKKRLEVLQMALLEPRFGILDETDSGLDIDALRIVAEGVNSLRSPERSFLVITHYQRLLDYIVPDTVHVLSKGRIVKTGGKELALELVLPDDGDCGSGLRGVGMCLSFRRIGKRNAVERGDRDAGQVSHYAGLGTIFVVRPSNWILSNPGTLRGTPASPPCVFFWNSVSSPCSPYLPPR